MQFFPSRVVLILLYGHWQSAWRKSLMAIAQKIYELYWINPESSIPQNSSYTVTNFPYLKPFKSDKPDMQDPAGEVMASS